MKEINATLYKVDGSKEPLTLNTKTSLETLQKLVGGLIEVIHINGKDLIINEEGRLLDLPINPWKFGLNTMWENEYFRGDVILVEGRLP